MPGDSKPARTPWVIVGVIMLVVVLLFLSPQSFRTSLSENVKSFILKVHSAARPNPKPKP
jgi:hypothetical protein